MHDQCGDQPVILTGKMLSPGMGCGNAYLYRYTLGREDEFYDIGEADIADEIDRFTQAVSRVADDLGALAVDVCKEMDDSLSDIFRAHVGMVRDPSLQAEVIEEIKKELVSAGTAVKVVFRRWELRFGRMEMEVARHKADDVHDLARRLIASLAGVRAHALESLPEGCVLVARRLVPSDTVFLARRKASAAILEYGGTGSHAALFAREIGLPCITGIADVLDILPEAAFTQVDADAAEAVVNPDQVRREDFAARSAQRRQANLSARESARLPAATRDGEVIAVYANVSCVDDTRRAVDNGADGIGLYRIEQAFLGRQTPPDAAALKQEIREVLQPAQHLPVYVRLLDVGADKPLPFMDTLREANPALGQRGIRFLNAFPDLLHTQLEVLLQLATEFDLNILVPMVTLPEDIASVKRQLTALAAEMQIDTPRLGAMIETPAAALSLCDLARHADFMSFGTNDLTQYAFATDRENATVERYFDDSHEVIFRFFDIAHRDLPDAQFSVCGELASRAESVPRLLQNGVTTLSVVPPLVPATKQAVRQT